MRNRIIPWQFLLAFFVIGNIGLFMASILWQAEAAAPKNNSPKCTTCAIKIHFAGHSQLSDSPPSIKGEVTSTELTSITDSPPSPYKVWVASVPRKITWKKFGPSLEKRLNEADAAGWNVHSVELGFRGGWVFVLKTKGAE